MYSYNAAAEIVTEGRRKKRFQRLIYAVENVIYKSANGMLQLCHQHVPASI